MKKLTIFISLAFVVLMGVSFVENSNFQQEQFNESINRGQGVYNVRCLSCHQANGAGLPGVFPPLADSDHLKTDSTSLINVILKGQDEKYSVKGIEYSMSMSSFAILSDREIADVLNFMGNSWGNKFGQITEVQVKNHRSNLKPQN